MGRGNAELLAECVLRDGVITIPGVSDGDYADIADEFRRDLLSLKVPHWKVVGAHITVGGQDVLSSYIDKRQGVSKSYAELLASLRNLIYAEGGGFPAKYIWMKETYGSASNFLEASFMMSTDSEVTTSSNILFESEPSRCAKSLILGKELVKFSKPGSMIQLILHRGTGCFTFKDAAYKVRLLNELIQQDDKLMYAPIEQDYDLTEVFSVKNNYFDDKGICLRYKMRIEEDVLQKIIRDYAIEKRDSDL